MSTTHYIYGLLDPTSRDLKYIGKSIRPKQRLWAHYQECKRAKHRRAQWINGVLAKDLRPILVILDQTTAESVNELECFYISYMRSLGCKLVNMTDGGDGVTMTPEIRAKISLATQGKNAGENHPNWGQQLSQETRYKISEANKGRPQHPNASQLGNTWSPERRELLMKQRSTRRKPIKLTNILTGETREFDQVRSACTSLGINRGNLIKTLKGITNHTKNWTGKYI